MSWDQLSRKMLQSAVLLFALGCGASTWAKDPTLLLAESKNATAVDAQVKDMGNADTQTLKLGTKKKLKVGGKVGTGVTGGTAAPLTKADCTKLGCTTYTDTSCPNVGGLTERCACTGGGNACINEVK